MNTRSIMSIVIVIVVLAGVYAITAYQGGVRLQDHILALDGDDTAAASRAIETLAGQGRRVVHMVEPLLTNPNPLVRSNAVTLIGMCGTADASDVLLPLLNSDEDQYVRRDVIVALGKLADGQTAPVLVAVLSDQQEEIFVRVAAATALGQLESADAEGPLLDALASRPPAPAPAEDDEDQPVADDTTLSLRVAAASALARLQSTQVIVGLRAAANETEETAPAVRVAATYALGDLSTYSDDEKALSEAIEGLLAACGDSTGDVRIAAVQSLGRVQLIPKVLEAGVSRALTNAEQDAHFWVRQAAVEARRSLGPLDV